jgi:Tfp pilus assembly protein PilO
VSRDRIIISIVASLGVVAAFWIGVLGPKRQELTDLNGQLAAQQQRLEKSQATAAQATAAKARYNADYSAVALLGKAVPSTEGVPSLLYQIDSAARGSKLELQSVSPSGGGAAAAAPGANAGTAGAAAAPAAAATGASGSTAPTPMPLSFVFTGSFQDMKRLLDRVNEFVDFRTADDVVVRGRLLSVDDIAIAPASGGALNSLQATISAVAYTMPAAVTPKGAATTSQDGAGGTAAPTTSTATANAAGAQG